VGRPDWAGLRGMDGLERACMVAMRFERELRYGKAAVFPIYIHDEKCGGRSRFGLLLFSRHALRSQCAGLQSQWTRCHGHWHVNGRDTGLNGL
jgi:hypothetical protein